MIVYASYRFSSASYQIITCIFVYRIKQWQSEIIPATRFAGASDQMVGYWANKYDPKRRNINAAYLRYIPK